MSRKRFDPFGPWLSHDQVPPVRRQFDLARDEYIRRQLLDADKSEKQRREEAAGRASAMVDKDKPAPALRPSRELRDAVDRASFSSNWMLEQRDAALAKAAPDRQQGHDLHHYRSASRSRSR